MLTWTGQLHKVWGLYLKENAHKLKFNVSWYFYLYGYEKYSVLLFFFLLLNVSYCIKLKEAWNTLYNYLNILAWSYGF